jgi:5-methylcytosine-specific restriction endonuclease McrA
MKENRTAAQRKEGWQGMNWIRQSSRLAIYLRDGMKCGYCAAGVEDGAQLTLDHLRPWSKGGSNAATNLITCCKQCNSSRGNKLLTDFAAPSRLAEIKNSSRRSLKEFRAQAHQLIALRGSAAKALALSQPTEKGTNQ